MINELHKADETQRFHLRLSHQYRSADGHPPNAPSPEGEWHLAK